MIDRDHSCKGQPWAALFYGRDNKANADAGCVDATELPIITLSIR
ncbi:hypothetical protein [Salinisphaera shabanensis]